MNKFTYVYNLRVDQVKDGCRIDLKQQPGQFYTVHLQPGVVVTESDPQHTREPCGGNESECAQAAE